MDAAGDRTSAGKQANGTGDSELAELRQIIVGQDLQQLSALEQRLDDPKVRAKETGAVLADAVRSASGKGLREAFEPMFERLFRNSVIKHPREISDSIYPVMGPAIRSYVAAAIREFAESLNQIAEKSVSWRAIRWRIEARIKGRPFSEILLSRSLLYSVDQVFLIHRNSGLLLAHVAAKSAVVKDADMVAGMLTAIQDFVSDSFTETGQELETVDIGRYKLWIQYGPKALLVGALRGTPPVELKSVFRDALEKIHEILLSPLESFKQGDASVFEPAHRYLESCLLGRRTPDRERNIVIWIVLTAAAGLILGLIVWYARSQQRWNDYVDALRRQPGIVVINAESSGSGGHIEGLKDPEAADPSASLRTFGLDPSKVRFSWQPYLSLNTPFAEGRQTQADLNDLQERIIRFEIGSSKLPLSEAHQIDESATVIRRILGARPEARIEITGHTDEVGTSEANAALSLDRATNVRQALAGQGIPLQSMTIRGAGNAEPLRNGGDEWDQAANRSVSIRLILNYAGPAGR